FSGFRFVVQCPSNALNSAEVDYIFPTVFESSGDQNGQEPTDHRDPQAACCQACRATRSSEDYGECLALGSRQPDRPSSQEGRKGSNSGARNSVRSQAGSAHGPQPGDGRGDQDQGQQESGLPRGQGVERVDLT